MTYYIKPFHRQISESNLQLITTSIWIPKTMSHENNAVWYLWIQKLLQDSVASMSQNIPPLQTQSFWVSYKNRHGRINVNNSVAKQQVKDGVL